jgi:hypothetical protein
MLTAHAAFRWAEFQNIGLDMHTIKNYFDMTLLLCPAKKPIAGCLTFSAFVSFSISCYSHPHLTTLLRSSANSIDSFANNDSIPQFVQIIRTMLQCFSNELTRIQTTLKLRLLPYMTPSFHLANAGKTTKVSMSVSYEDQAKVLCFIVEGFERSRGGYYALSSYTGEDKLYKRWNGSKFISFCKYIGLLYYTQSLYPCWLAFMSSTHQMKVQQNATPRNSPTTKGSILSGSHDDNQIDASIDLLITLLHRAISHVIDSKTIQIFGKYVKSLQADTVGKTLVKTMSFVMNNRLLNDPNDVKPKTDHTL